jgi:hypothetical protein
VVRQLPRKKTPQEKGCLRFDRGLEFDRNQDVLPVLAQTLDDQTS